MTRILSLYDNHICHILCCRRVLARGARYDCASICNRAADEWIQVATGSRMKQWVKVVGHSTIRKQAARAASHRAQPRLMSRASRVRTYDGL